MNLQKTKIDKSFIILLIIFAIISIITIKSSTILLPINKQNIVYKQILWYTLGFTLSIIMTKFKNNFFIKNIFIFYIIGNILLVLLLIFGKTINNAKCWFTLPIIGGFQPSEFVKIILIILLASEINKFNEKYPHPNCKEEFLFLLKMMIIVLIPSILTFLEPDTGIVLIYLIITLSMLFISGIRYRWFIILGIILALTIGTILAIYFINNELFIKIFGTSFFLRVDRLLDWSKNSGYQLENGLSAIGSGGLFGNGLNKTPLYFPEPQTDFIFAVYASNFGFIGSTLLIVLILIFDIKLILLAKKTTNLINKYIIAGIIGMLIYQQIQNIGMTIGLLPITGITLPFISYGGSSLLSYMIIAGLILNISKEKRKQVY